MPLVIPECGLDILNADPIGVRAEQFIDAGFAAERVIAGSVPSANNAGSGSVAYPGFGAQK